MNTAGKDNAFALYWIEAHENSILRQVFDMNMDESSFNSLEESMKKTIETRNQAFFYYEEYLTANPAFGCKVFIEILVQL